MTAQFHKGQEVEVYYPFSRLNISTWPWVPGRILYQADGIVDFGWHVSFPDGTRAVFDAEHIRAIDTRTATEADFELYD